MFGRSLIDIYADPFLLFVRGMQRGFSNSAMDRVGTTIRVVDDSTGDDFASISALWAIARPQASSIPGDDAGLSKTKQLLGEGRVCIAAFNNNEALGMAWLASEGVIDNVDFARCLAPYAKRALVHDIFVLPHARGNRLQMGLLQACHQFGRSHGIERLFAFVGVRNFASIRNFMRSFDSYQLVTHLKFDVPGFTFHRYPGFDSDQWFACESP